MIRIRPAVSDDAGFLAWVMLSSSRSHLQRGIWDLLIGAGETGCLDYLKRLALAEPRSLCHYSNYLVAEVGSQPAAALCGFATAGSPWAVVGEAMSNVQRDLGWTEGEATAAYQRVAPIWACFLPDCGADFSIENVATLAEFQRRGLASTLIERMLADARERGCKLAQITTYLGNHAAQGAYEKSGFRVLDEKRCSGMEEILGVPGFMRLTRDL